MIIDGLILMLVGMGMVITFLLIMIFLVNLLHKLFVNFETVPQDSLQVSRVEQHKKMNHIPTVISAAIHAHQMRKGKS